MARRLCVQARIRIASSSRCCDGAATCVSAAVCSAPCAATTASTAMHCANRGDGCADVLRSDTAPSLSIWCRASRTTEAPKVCIDFGTLIHSSVMRVFVGYSHTASISIYLRACAPVALQSTGFARSSVYIDVYLSVSTYRWFAIIYIIRLPCGRVSDSVSVLPSDATRHPRGSAPCPQ